MDICIPSHCETNAQCSAAASAQYSINRFSSVHVAGLASEEGEGVREGNKSKRNSNRKKENPINPTKTPVVYL